MFTTYTIQETRDQISQWKAQGLKVALVPTMGFLHEGHESLMQSALKMSDRLVVSIFVNPAQFGPGEDLDRYPRDMEHDLEVCKRNCVDLVFSPDPMTIYPQGYSTYVEVQGLAEGLCGKSRPGHFRGVCTVVNKLFNIVQPDFAFFGQKDAQQLAVIKRMSKDLNLPLKVLGCPIIREKDGLAKSSRNAYLSPDERHAALALSRSLSLAQKAIEVGERNAAALTELIMSELQSSQLVRADYVEIVDNKSLKPLDRLEGEVLIALAAYVGKTRLIDNTLINL